MSLLIEHPSCDLLVADKSFGDLQTPLHKSASGGRYLAVKLLLEALTKRNLLREAVTRKDADGMSPLDVAIEKRTRSEMERQTVVRWNSVAGGLPDWNKCVLLLENAASKLIPMNSTCMTKPALSLPDHLDRNFQLDWNCLSTQQKCFCVTASWEKTFREALDQTVRDVIGESSHENSTGGLPNVMTRPLEEGNKCERKKHSNSPAIGRECHSCGSTTIVLFPRGNGYLVCKNCRRRDHHEKTIMK
jgi:hypothetical protein